MRYVPLAILGALGCGGGGGDGGGGPDPDLVGWESAEVTTDDGEIVIEKVSYRSEGLRIWGQVCRPAAPGVYPVIVMNHGGFFGLGAEWNGGGCAGSARSGFVTIESSYRGEDGSDGNVEICLGEVTDVLRMIEIITMQDYADPSRMVMWGASHGGCVTTRAVQRGAPVVAAIDVFGPSDWAAEHAFMRAGMAAGGPLARDYQELVAVLESVTGGTPETVPAAYEARSPISFAAELASAPSDFLIVQGVQDAVVPAAQSCNLAAAAGGFESYHLDANGAESTRAPAGCGPAALTWLRGPRPQPTWPGARYLVVYDAAGHDLANASLAGDVLSFLLAKVPQ